MYDKMHNGYTYLLDYKGLNESNFMKLRKNTCTILQIQKATNAAAKGELGRHAVLPHLLSHSAKYWLRLCSHDSSSLVYKAYLEMYKDTTERKVTENWVVRVQTLWKEFGIFGVWENQGSLYKNKTVKIPKSNMLDRYEHNWLAHVGLSPTFGTTGTKLRTYIQFKHTFGLENYILVERKFQRRQTWPN